MRVVFLSTTNHINHLTKKQKRNFFDMKKYLTIEQVSELMHIKVGTARNRLCRGESMPPLLRVGRRVLFPEESFYAWMDSFLPHDEA